MLGSKGSLSMWPVLWGEHWVSTSLRGHRLAPCGLVTQKIRDCMVLILLPGATSEHLSTT